MIEIRNLSKSYNKGQVKAVDGLDLKVNRGEIFGFLGPNGAGKTTTIKMIVGLLNPDTGTITIDGTDIVKEPIEAKRKIGYVPDEPTLYERLTGFEYLNFMADVYQVPGSVRKERIINKGKLIAIGTVDELRHGDRKDSLEKIFLELTEQ